MNDTDEVIDRLIALDELTPHPRNYKKHPASQVEKLAASLQSFGQPRTIAVWRGTILAGHGVTQAAQHLGWQQIRASIVPDSWTEARAQAYVVADNETQRGAEIDEVELAALLDEARLEIDLEAMGFDEAAFDALLAGLTEETPTILGVDDTVDKGDRAGSSPWDRITASDTVRVLIGDLEFGVAADVARDWVAAMQQQDNVREAARIWLEQRMQS
jgi:ParB-like chromosome segregation protein Spo0J